MFRTYKTCNPMVEFFKNKFINKLLGGVTLSNVTPPSYLLLNSYFKNRTVELLVLYMLNMHVNFHANWMLFILWSINSTFMNYFKHKNLNLNN